MSEPRRMQLVVAGILAIGLTVGLTVVLLAPRFPTAVLLLAGLGTVGGGLLLARLTPRLTLRSAVLLVVEVAVLLLILYLWRRGP